MGSILGAIGHYIFVYSDIEYDEKLPELLSAVIQYSDYQISNDNFACEGDTNKNVGSVLASIIGDGMGHKVNPLSAGCGGQVCSISFTYCKPWQSEECGSRFLAYEQHANGNIKPETFRCLDIP